MADTLPQLGLKFLDICQPPSQSNCNYTDIMKWRMHQFITRKQRQKKQGSAFHMWCTDRCPVTSALWRTSVSTEGPEETAVDLRHHLGNKLAPNVRGFDWSSDDIRSPSLDESTTLWLRHRHNTTTNSPEGASTLLHGIGIPMTSMNYKVLQ